MDTYTTEILAYYCGLRSKRKLLWIIRDLWGIGCLIVMAYIFIFDNINSYNYSLEINLHYSLYAKVSVGFIVFVILTLPFAKLFQLTRLDCLLLLFLILSLGIIAFSNDRVYLNNERFCYLTTWLMVYFIARGCTKAIISFVLPCIFFAFYLYELYLGLKQIYFFDGYSLVKHPIGSLANSGIFAIYLVSNIPLVIYTGEILFRRLKTIKKIATIVLLILTIVEVMYLGSRTAIICLLALFILGIKFNHYPNWISFLQKNRYSLLIVFIGLLALGLSASILTDWKINSLLGRAFIWKVSLSNLKEYWFNGVGLGQFGSVYPHWQIRYNVQHNLSQTEFLNAGDTHVAFNDLLQISVESGLLGFIIFLIIVRRFFLNKQNVESTTRVWQQTGLVILTSSVTSYPLLVNSVTLLFIIARAQLSPQNFIINTELSRSHITNFAFLIAFFLLLLSNIYFSFSQSMYVKKWITLSKDVFAERKEVLNGYRTLYPKLKTHGKFLVEYGEQLFYLGEYQKSAAVFEESKKFYLSERSLLIQARAYEWLQDADSAIANFKRASLLVPYRFRTKEKLVQLYQKIGDTAKSVSMAKQILTMPVKIPSPAVDAIKMDMRTLLRLN